MAVSVVAQQVQNPLPENYLPVAMAYFSGAEEASRLLLDVVAGDLKRPVTAASIRLEDNGFAETGVDSENAFYLGPLAPTDAASRTYVPPEQEPINALVPPPIVAIIDIGIPFWHPRFQIDGKSVFTQMILIEDPSIENRTGAATVLSEADIADSLARIEAEGLTPERIFEIMGESHPGSIYAGIPDVARKLHPDSFAHGCAMADIAFNNVSDTVLQSTNVVGVELPAEVIMNRNGDLLQAMLITALKSLVSVTDAILESSDVVVLIPYGFLGGPHDGSHPIAKALETFLAEKNKPGQRSLEVILPTGNHLSEGQHSRLEPVHFDVEGISDPLCWFVPDEDYTDNTVEICWKNSAVEFKLTTTSAEQFNFTFNLENTEAEKVERCVDDDGKTLAMAHHKHADGWNKTRITLAATNSETGIPSNAGRWKITLHALEAPTTVDFWILRDDAPNLSFKNGNTSQSRFLEDEYESIGQDGAVIADDTTINPTQKIRREGTASVLSTTSHRNVTRVGAKRRSGGGLIQAEFSGSDYPGLVSASMPTSQLVDRDQMALVRATGGRGIVQGTSVAAAKELNTSLRRL